MKQYTHAWLSFMAIRRIEEAKISGRSDRAYAKRLVAWFKDHNDDVIQGAWYPDAVVKDMAKSHVLKIKPSSSTKKNAKNEFRPLPTTYHCYKHRKESPLWEKYYVVNKNDNLPDRCESIAHSVIDQLKMQCCEDKGSPVSPTNNQIGLLLFMLSHYVADAHVPFHCDSRKLDSLHAAVERCWDKMVRVYYEIDEKNGRFFCDKDGYPAEKTVVYKKLKGKYPCPYLKKIISDLSSRDFVISWGETKDKKNNNVWDFISAICQYSYLLAYSLVPVRYGSRKITLKYLEKPGDFSFDNCSYYVLSDAIDSIARVWFRVWRHYMKWKAKKMNRRKKAKKKRSAKKKQKAGTKRNTKKTKTRRSRR